jgi:hypothetical protein
MRVAFLDTTDSSQQCCPSALRQLHFSNVRTCAIEQPAEGCSSVTFSITVRYSLVCGKISTRASGTPDGFRGSVVAQTLDSNYVDGVSLTHGDPRQHIWTFAADEVDQNCSCEHSPPSFIDARHYFCDARSRDIAWNGTGCLPNNPPWFHRVLSSGITDDIEMRVCRDQPSTNEDIGITNIELYVQ